MKKFLAVPLMFFLASFSAAALTARTVSDHDTTTIHVTYYHGTIRCHTCLMIEQFSAMTMQSSFGKQLAAGTIIWKAEDYEAENDSMAVQKYGIENQSLILSKRVNGREIDWKLLPKIWDYAGDYEKFRKYIMESIDSFSD
jgi:hypothetical protein